MFEFKYHTDLNSLHVNCEAPRAYFVPYDTAEKALAGNRADSDRLISLCGDWDFRFYPSEAQMDDFLSESFTTEGFDTMTVPRSWQTVMDKGYDVPQYTNVAYPFPFDPPHVPSVNPCALYCRELTLTQAALEHEIYINFEGVDSCFYLFVNGKFAGYSEVSHSTSEINITPLLHAGVNTFRVVVFKWCTGSYLEDQDKFRLSGMFREVYLLLRDKKHLKDVYLRPSLSADYSQGTLSLETLSDSPIEYEYTLVSPSGETVATGFGSSAETPTLTVTSPELWCDELPNLYTLLIKAGDEYLSFPFGFKELVVKNGVVYINGKKVKARGMNRHDSHPILGGATPFAHMLEDLYIMKRHNINTVRASHYPNDPRFAYLCDKLGFYLVNEADIETHGAQLSEKWGYFTDSALWADAFLDRCTRLFERDKNHVCVIMWSTGNEMGVGKNQARAYEYFHSRQPQCLVHCEDFSRRHAAYHLDAYPKYKNNPHIYPPFDDRCCDVSSYMYWMPNACRDTYLKSPKARTPFYKNMPLFLCEYSHAMGLGPGDLNEYWDLIWENDRFFGGCIWEFTDHSVATGEDIYNAPRYIYGGDFDELPNSGNFCVDGMVYPDRRPHTGLLEYKQVIKPFAVTEASLKDGFFRIKNRRFFTYLSDCSVYWSVTRDGKTLKQGFIPSPAIKPQSSRKFFIDLKGIDTAAGGELTVSLRSNTATEWAEAAYELGFQQISFAAETVKSPIADTVSENATLSACETAHSITVTAGERIYTFNKLEGALVSMKDNGHELLASAVKPTIWRAPTDNERTLVAKYRENFYHRMMLNCLGMSLDSVDEKQAVISAHLTLGGYSRIPVLDITVTYTVTAEGGVITDAVAKQQNPTFHTEIFELPRFGFEFAMPEHNEYISYLGRGETENYSDLNNASKIGVYNTTVSKNFEHYIRPQENSAHGDTRWMTVSNAAGQGICVLSVDKPFSFNCSHYSVNDIDLAAHDYELTPRRETFVNIDYAQTGIGSASCGTKLDPKYKLTEPEMKLSFRILPANVNNVSLSEEYGRR